MDAVQRAAYRLSDRLSAEVSATPETIDVTLHLPENGDGEDGLLADFRNEVLDQALRERIRSETEDVRKLVLAVAFSRTGLGETGV